MSGLQIRANIRTSRVRICPRVPRACACRLQ